VFLAQFDVRSSTDRLARPNWRALAQLPLGSENALICFDMSE